MWILPVYLRPRMDKVEGHVWGRRAAFGQFWILAYAHTALVRRSHVANTCLQSLKSCSWEYEKRHQAY